MMNRREVLATTGVAASLMATQGAVALAPAAQRKDGIRWISTRPDAPWRSVDLPVQVRRPDGLETDIMMMPGGQVQTVTGFGGAFSEMGWDALSVLSPADRATIMAALFGRDGAAFTLCRTPIGASDFARRWYSYDETDGDFELRDFSIANDRQALIPFIKAARAVQPDLKLWASPWSPPTWMKTNKRYAMALSDPGKMQNGVGPDQVGKTGTDAFIQDDRHFAAYARYFRRYIEGYRAAGVPISMVMPQNEFNSMQAFPSCNWTVEGLARFLPFLGKEMDAVGVGIFFGTLERAQPDMFSTIMSHPEAAQMVRGLGLQWAGIGALPELRRRYPSLPMWGTEQECGNGRNDWLFAGYAWNLMRRYFDGGANAYQYWNMALPSSQLSGWGWRQNSLVSVNVRDRTFAFNPDYHIIRHASQFVRIGAHYMPAYGFAGHDTQMVFINPDKSVVILIANALTKPQPVNIRIDQAMVSVELPSGSFNTIVIPPERLASVR